MYDTNDIMDCDDYLHSPHVFCSGFMTNKGNRIRLFQIDHQRKILVYSSSFKDECSEGNDCVEFPIENALKSESLDDGNHTGKEPFVRLLAPWKIRGLDPLMWIGNSHWYSGVHALVLNREWQCYWDHMVSELPKETVEHHMAKRISRKINGEEQQ